jgi:hypothetical protein
MRIPLRIPLCIPMRRALDGGYPTLLADHVRSWRKQTNDRWRRQPLLTRSRHRAEAFQIEAQAGPGSGIPPAKMSQRVSLSDGEGLLPSLCSDEPRAERTDQRVRQRSTDRVRDFVFARSAERPVFARPNLWCMIFIDCERHGVIEQTEARSWAAKMSPNGNSAAMHAAIEPRRAGAE